MLFNSANKHNNVHLSKVNIGGYLTIQQNLFAMLSCREISQLVTLPRM